MVKIFRYECKRLLWNKFFFGILAVTLFYGWQVLTGASILGVSHTAPFSPWTFGDYLSRLLPLLWIGVLFFLTFFTSGAERRAAVLTAATPVRPLAIRSGPAGGGTDRHRPPVPRRPVAVRCLLCPHVSVVQLGQSGSFPPPYP